MMTCTECGRAQDPSAQFCSSCGRALTANSYVDANGLATFRPGRLARPRGGRMVAGVCAGFAQAYEWDLALVRMVVALSVLFAGVPLIAYVVAWIVMPNEPLALPAQAGAGPGSMAV